MTARDFLGLSLVTARVVWRVMEVRGTPLRCVGECQCAVLCAGVCRSQGCVCVQNEDFVFLSNFDQIKNLS